MAPWVERRGEGAGKGFPSTPLPLVLPRRKKGTGGRGVEGGGW